MKRPLFIYFASTILVLFWVYVGLTKLVDTSMFVSQLEYQPLPEWSITILKWNLPILALIAATLIYYKWTRFAGLILSSILLLIYTIYVTITASGALGVIPCDYAAAICNLSWALHLLFNIILTIISWLGVYQHRKQYQYLIRQKGGSCLKIISSDRINRWATENRYKKTGFK